MVILFAQSIFLDEKAPRAKDTQRCHQNLHTQETVTKLSLFLVLQPGQELLIL